MRSTARRSEPLAYTTVMTVMNRLTAKNVLTRHGERRSYAYEATAPTPPGSLSATCSGATAMPRSRTSSTRHAPTLLCCAA